VPHLRVAAAPAFGAYLVWSRSQVLELAQAAMAAGPPARWTGPDRVLVVRRSRRLAEEELIGMLTRTLSAGRPEDAQLEVRLSRPWAAVAVPDEPVTLRLLDVSSGELTARCLARFELASAGQTLGTWQVPVQARLMAPVYVTPAAVRAGQPLADAGLVLEPRDLLTLRDALRRLPDTETNLEFAEYVAAGMPLSTRSVRPRPLVRRGHVVDAIVAEGALTITVQAEALEDGRSGESIRLRNVKSRREFRGKVHDENTIVLAL
jgi:flagella basal body P-ring formation protein FlgA